MTMNNSAETCAEKILVEPCLHSASSHCVACASALIERERLMAKIEQVEAMERQKWEVFGATIDAAQAVPVFKPNYQWIEELRAQLAARPRQEGGANCDAGVGE